jgi:hypothetical protein
MRNKLESLFADIPATICCGPAFDAIPFSLKYGADAIPKIKSFGGP